MDAQTWNQLACLLPAKLGIPSLRCAILTEFAQIYACRVALQLHVYINLLKMLRRYLESPSAG